MACDYSSTVANLIANCNPWENRQDGDVLIIWDQQGSVITISQRTFLDPDGPGGTPGAFDPGVVLNSSTAIAVLNGDATGGELAVNFSAIVTTNPNECITFANIIPTTLTGNSDTADYKDTVLSDFPILSNCGTVTVKKVTSPAGSAGTFQYTLADGTPMFGVATADSDCTVSGANNLNQCIGELVDQETDTITDLLAGTNYTLIESFKPSNFGLTSIICTPEGGTGLNITAGGTFPVAAAKTTACVITNTVLTGELRLIKVVVNGFGLSKVPGDFSFSLDGGALTAFANGTPPVSCDSGVLCKTFTFNVGTSHTFTEPAGGQQAGYQASVPADCANMVVVAGSPKTCTITNTAQQNTVAATTQQRVLLFDRATVTGIRRAAGEGAMSVAFELYATLAACNADTTPNAEVVPITLAAGQTSIQVGTGTGIEIALNINPGDETNVRYWRALFSQAGASPPNAPFLTTCNEITTVRLQQ